MEYQNNSTKKDAEKSTNTSGIQFMNSENPKTQSTLIIKWWNNFMALQISPALPEKDRKENKIFDYQTQINTALSPEKLMVLNYIINKEIKPALEENREVGKAIPVGSAGLIELGTRKIDYGTNIGEKITPFITIYKGLDANTRKAESALTYYFNLEIPLITDYDMDSGLSKVEYIDTNEFELFTRLLPDSAVALCGAYAHIARYHDRYYTARISKNIEAIGNNLGAPIDSANSYRKYTGKSSDIFSRSASNNSTESSTNGEMSVSEGLDDIPF